MKVRNILISWHGLIGLFMGLLFVIIGLTGGAIVFYPEIDQALNPGFWSVTPQAEQVTLDTIVSNFERAYPNLPIQSIRFPLNKKISYLIRAKSTNEKTFEAFINPYTGQVLGSRIWEQSLMGFLYTLHHDLLLGKVGTILVGITGIMLLIVASTGIILWTGWRKLLNGFKIRFNSAAPIINYDLHKVGGITSSILLLIVALTGVVIVVFHLLPSLRKDVQEVVIPVPKQPPISLHSLLAKADQAMPGGQVTYLQLNQNQPRKVNFIKKFPEQKTGRFDLSTVEIDRYTGKVLLVNKVISPTGIFKFLLPVAEFHSGTFGGLPTRILYVFLGVVPTFLLITGLLLWRRKQWLREKRNTTIKLTSVTKTN